MNPVGIFVHKKFSLYNVLVSLNYKDITLMNQNEDPDTTFF